MYHDVCGRWNAQGGHAPELPVLQLQEQPTLVTTCTTPVKSAGTRLRQRHVCTLMMLSVEHKHPTARKVLRSEMKLMTLPKFTTFGCGVCRLMAEEESVQMLRDPVEAGAELEDLTSFCAVILSSSENMENMWVSTELLKLRHLVDSKWCIGRECAKLPSLMRLDAIARVDGLLELSQGPLS